jgi:hypothetical protein
MRSLPAGTPKAEACPTGVDALGGGQVRGRRGGRDRLDDPVPYTIAASSANPIRS